MDFLAITNCILTLGIVIFAFLQWLCSNSLRKTELVKYKIKHIHDFKNFWNDFMENMDYVANYRAKFNIPQDYQMEYNKIFKFLDEHLDFSKFYFTKNIAAKEQEFVELLKNILPNPTADASICDMKNEFDKIQQSYTELVKMFINKM